MRRRGFLGTIAGLAAAPFVVRPVAASDPEDALAAALEAAPDGEMIELGSWIPFEQYRRRASTGEMEFDRDKYHDVLNAVASRVVRRPYHPCRAVLSLDHPRVSAVHVDRPLRRGRFVASFALFDPHELFKDEAVFISTIESRLKLVIADLKKEVRHGGGSI
jgi:hypothetical protein